MTSRLIRTPKCRGLRAGTDVVCTTTFTPDPAGKDGLREHVTLETPRPTTDTQRIRALSTWEKERQWRTS